MKGAWNNPCVEVKLSTFMTYAGSKDKILDQILPYLNASKKDVMVDLFCGGGSVASAELKFKHVIANDINKDLIEAEENMVRLYQTSPDAFDENIALIMSACPENKDQYVKYRAKYNSEQEEADRWTEFLVLASCCTNNLIRYNRRGEFNQTYGERKMNPHSVERMKDFCRRVCSAHQDIVFSSSDYRKFTDSIAYSTWIGGGTACYYIDPPYSNSTVKYTSWNSDDDKELLSFIEALSVKGNDIIVSSFVKNGERTEIEDGLVKSGFTEHLLSQDYSKGARIKTNQYQETLYVKMS